MPATLFFSEEQHEGIAMKKEKVYFIYVTENLINGKLYIGQHTCDYDKQFTDGYLGSGHAFKNALKKYGEENFRRIIVEYANNPEELDELEAKYVDDEVIESDRFYNLKTGGSSRIIYSEELRKKIGETSRGRHHSEETKERLRKANSGENNPMFGKSGILAPCYGRTGNKHPMFGKHHSEETKKKISEHSSHHNLGIHLSDETKQKISQANKGNKNCLGRKLSEETKAKIGAKSKGRHHSEEARKKMSIAQKGNKHSLGYHHSEETRKKMSIAQKNRLPDSEETRKRKSEVKKLWWLQKKQSLSLMQETLF